MTNAVRSRAARSLSSCSYFNKKYLSFYELYLKLLKSPSSIFCTIINLVSSNSKQDSSIFNFAKICSGYGVNPNFGINTSPNGSQYDSSYESKLLTASLHKIKQLSHVHGVNPHLGLKTPLPRAWCETSLGIKHHVFFSYSIHELVQQFLPHNTRSDICEQAT